MTAAGLWTADVVNDEEWWEGDQLNQFVLFVHAHVALGCSRDDRLQARSNMSTKELARLWRTADVRFNEQRYMHLRSQSKYWTSALARWLMSATINRI